MKITMTDHNMPFPGFPPAPVTNYWPYPKALNGWWATLTPTEQKVLDYILRHTWGYKKTADAISISQFMFGIMRRDGSSVDGGTGIQNEKTIRKALKGLVAKSFISQTSAIGAPSIFSLRIDPSQELVEVPNNGTTPLPKNTTDPSQNLVPTINKSITNNNTVSTSGGNMIHSFGGTDVQAVIEGLSRKLGGVRFPNYGKQARYAKSMLGAGYTLEEILWAIDQMLANQWWRENSFDLKNVADEIPKLMTRTTKVSKGQK